MAVSLETVLVALVLFLVTLYLTVKPVKGMGLVNLVFGLVGIIVSVASFALVDALPFFPWFSVAYGLVSTLCLLVAPTVK